LLSAELMAKRLGILRDLLPSVKRIAMLVNPTRPEVDGQKTQMQEATQRLGLSLHILDATDERDFDAVFQAVVREENSALVVAPDSLFLDRRVQIADLATRYKIPTMYELRQFVEAGGLISYGASAVDLYRQGGTLTAQILTGKKPADLPVLQPTKLRARELHRPEELMKKPQPKADILQCSSRSRPIGACTVEFSPEGPDDCKAPAHSHHIPPPALSVLPHLARRR
jgi:hypothetical protein